MGERATSSQQKMGLRRGTKPVVESDSDDLTETIPIAPRKRNAPSSSSSSRRVVKSDSEESDNNNKKKQKREVIVLSSDEEEKAPPKKLQKKGKGKAKAVESDEESEDDLEFELKDLPPTQSGKAKTRSALDALKAKRAGLSSSSPRKKNAESEEEEEEEEEYGDEEEDEGSGSEDSFLDDSSQPLQDFPPPDNVTGLSPEEKFEVFVRCLLELRRDPELSTLSETSKLYLRDGKNYITRDIQDAARTIAAHTWRAPFQYTLERRFRISVTSAPPDTPQLDDEGARCEACWLRGMKSCYKGGHASFSFKKGLYDPETHKTIKEKKDREKYTTTTFWENNAEAPKALYPTGFVLVVGSRCVSKATQFLDTYHFPHKTFAQIEEDLEGEEFETTDEEFDHLQDNGQLDAYWKEYEALKEAVALHGDYD